MKHATLLKPTLYVTQQLSWEEKSCIHIYPFSLSTSKYILNPSLIPSQTFPFFLKNNILIKCIPLIVQPITSKQIMAKNPRKAKDLMFSKHWSRLSFLNLLAMRDVGYIHSVGKCLHISPSWSPSPYPEWAGTTGALLQPTHPQLLVGGKVMGAAHWELRNSPVPHFR